MIALDMRLQLLALLTEACKAGARWARACALIGLSVRTVQRWQRPQATGGDLRASDQRKPCTPRNQLSEAERLAALELLNSEEFKNLPPSQIVPRLADQGRYVASESTLYRLMRQSGQLTHRRVERAPQKRSKPRALAAVEPDQIYCWDITYLPTAVRGSYFYLYLFVDLFSRKVVGWQVYDRESTEQASALMQDICQRQGIEPGQLSVHSDNGSPMRGETMLATLQRLGIAPSRSRPGVSNDNPYSESLFRTLKYRPELPVKPFADLLQARRWVGKLVDWYNQEHRHSGIGFVTPDQRHSLLDGALLQARHEVYEAAQRRNPSRWSRNTRDWSRRDIVHLNPDKSSEEDVLKKTH
ncbi:MAG: IS3 family transposase [Hydrogenophaga sp.]|jgi:transposase InsO family protein|uniref:IS3 family transposase n=2 Tax=Hydrogenophaga sp. TaxID=1904254 RepID=UPI002726E8A9|nr:IS3 family transposase [Hydrogenophaga sp.]MDO9482644.1 IS3 family transposase [Hydrogenophaga sp.]MDP2094178.1 IS3 family transposase [Hydrogenophaga sp.]MDP3343334.1 IS3 family transposase [Hydrogenophaga sp.]MDP3805428.1 IS3 family transposase [Hydrogenophaga sp.]MDP3926607.1 IS3 family transposase [Hydrogenophaga sp.]